MNNAAMAERRPVIFIYAEDIQPFDPFGNSDHRDSQLSYFSERASKFRSSMASSMSVNACLGRPMIPSKSAKRWREFAKPELNSSGRTFASNRSSATDSLTGPKASWCLMLERCVAREMRNFARSGLNFSQCAFPMNELNDFFYECQPLFLTSNVRKKNYEERGIMRNVNWIPANQNALLQVV